MGQQLNYFYSCIIVSAQDLKDVLRLSLLLCYDYLYNDVFQAHLL